MASDISRSFKVKIETKHSPSHVDLNRFCVLLITLFGKVYLDIGGKEAQYQLYRYRAFVRSIFCVFILLYESLSQHGALLQ